MKSRINLLFLSCLFILNTGWADSQKHFQNPPLEKGPWVYWMWMNGNITREGITADLEAMQHVGVAGALIMSVTVEIPQGPVTFFSEEWRALFQHALQEADRLGLQIVMNNDAGFTGSGGPWNTPENSMQRITWSETVVEGPREFRETLPRPPTPIDFYRDIALYALKMPHTADASRSAARVTCNEAGKDLTALTDGDPYTAVQLPIPKPNRPTWFQWEFPEPRTIHAFSLRSGFSPSIAWGRVETSDDGKNWKSLTNFYIPNAGAMQAYAAEAFAPTTARFFRLLIHRTHPRVRIVNMAEIELHDSPRISEWGAKGGYVRGQNIPPEFGGVPSDAGITKAINLTDKMDEKGLLNWSVPEGRWTLLRVGHSSTNKDNHPAPEAGRGLEVDKMSATALRAHWNAFMGKLAEAAGPLAGKTFAGTHIDSWEVGAQNWTPNFIAQFKARRGYDPTPWIPTVSGGYILENREKSERFLWDFRKTIADLIADEYYGALEQQAGEKGLFLSVEAYNNGNFDNILSAGRSDIPMHEFWLGQDGAGRVFQTKQATAAAQGYGKNIVAAEAFTCGTEHGRWQNSPDSLKPLGDYFFAAGTNRFIFHRWAMQPWTDRWPGMTFGPYGIHYERTVTWFEQSRPWIQYLARCQSLLQQGTFVGDLLFFQGEGAPNGVPNRGFDKKEGYDYGYCNDETILSMTVEEGRLILPASGTGYSLLVLDNSRFMTPELLENIAQLVQAGAHVLGPKPEQSPSLVGYPECDSRVQKMAAQLWGDTSQPGSKKTGMGMVYWGKKPEAVIQEMGLQPDLTILPADRADSLVWIHRRLPDRDFYFLGNQADENLEVEISLPDLNRMPERWHPETGDIDDLCLWESMANGRLRLPLSFEPYESFFLVFRRAATQPTIVALSRKGKPAHDAAPAELKVLQATYGIPGDEKRSVDVTARVRQALASGAAGVRAFPKDLAVADPAVHVVKTLSVTFEREGKRWVEEVQDMATLAFPAALPEETPWMEIRDNRLLASQPGLYEVRYPSGETRSIEVKNVPKPLTLSGPWHLAFPPQTVYVQTPLPPLELESLVSWTELPQPHLRHFSGTGIYECRFTLSKEQVARDMAVRLNLGRVGVIAEVELNGKNLAILWNRPFRMEVADHLQAGENRLVLKVTNTWVNQLIGDAAHPSPLKWNHHGAPDNWPEWIHGGQIPETGRKTFVTWDFFKPNEPLQPSGLMGPVRLTFGRTTALGSN